MKDVKKTLKISGIVCICAALISVLDILLDIYIYDSNWLMIVVDSLLLVLSIVTGAIYLLYKNKSDEYIFKHKGVFTTLMLVNILNNIIVWAMSFYVQIVVNNCQRTKFFTSVKYTNTVDDRDTIIIEPSDYEITSKVDLLSDEIGKLERLKKKGAITEEEFLVLKKELIEKFL